MADNTRPYEVLILPYAWPWKRVDRSRYKHLSAAIALADEWAQDPDVIRAQVRDKDRRTVYETEGQV